MPVLTSKRCQAEANDWYYLVEDCDLDLVGEPGSGLTIRFFDDNNIKGITCLSVGLEDALLIRDAINQLYPKEQR